MKQWELNNPPSLYTDNHSLTHSETLDSSFKRSLKLLLNSERSLFLIFLINFSTSLQFYILVTLIPLYFTTEFGYSDTISGIIFGCFGVAIGVFSIYLSYIMDQISLKLGLYFSFFIGIFGFGLLLIENSIISIVSVVLVQSISCAIAWPYAEYAVKEYSTEEIRNMSSSCFFISNYLAGIVAGVLIDYMWANFKEPCNVYYWSFIIGALALIFAAICFKFCRSLENLEQESKNHEGLLSYRGFLRFSILIILLVLLRSASFGHLDATLPKYLMRTQGSTSHFGLMLSIHSCTMITGLLTLTILTYHYTSYDLICVGGLFGAISSILVIFWDNTIVYVFFVVFISIGESIWVPRLLDYTYAVAPKGREGIYLAMSNCPFYFGMILTGTESGVMFDLFCSADSSSKCNFIWILVFLSSFCIFFMLIIFKKFITGGDEYRSEIEYKLIND